MTAPSSGGVPAPRPAAAGAGVTVSIVVPVYQNEPNLPETLPRLLALGTLIPDCRLELLFVDDGSRDRSLELLQAFRAEHPDVVTVIKLTRNFGQIPAINIGLRHARGDCVGIISADLQDPCELFVDMVEAWRRGYTLVIGERVGREETGLGVLASNTYWRLVRRLAVPKFPEGGFDFCLIDRALAREAIAANHPSVNIFVTLGFFGYPEYRIPYIRTRRRKGRSQWTLFGKIDLMLSTLFSFTDLPIKACLYLGGLTCLLSILYAIILLGVWLVHGSPVMGWMTLALLQLAFGGTTILFLGVIGEYLWQLTSLARRRPDAVVEYVVRGPARLPSSADGLGNADGMKE